MEPWKIAAIVALGASIVGYGVFANSPANRDLISGARPTAAPTTVATKSKYIGQTLPGWPSMKQWVNTPSPVNLSSLKGKPVFLEVFRTQCSHCNEAAPFLVQLHARYKPRGVQFVAVQSPGDYKDPENPENDWKLVQSWLKQRGYTWPVGFDAQSAWFQGKFGKGVSYPSMYLIDSSGKVVFYQSGHSAQKEVDLGVELEKLAPTKGDLRAKAESLSRFLASGLGITSDKNAQTSLALELADRLESSER